MGALGHVVSIDLETEINNVDNQSTVDCVMKSNKNSGHQSSGKLPWWPTPCVLSHTNESRVTHPDAKGKGQWKLHIWKHLTLLYTSLPLADLWL